MGKLNKPRLGAIVLASVHDPDTGAVLDPHFCVVLTANEEINAGAEL